MRYIGGGKSEHSSLVRSLLPCLDHLLNQFLKSCLRSEVRKSVLKSEFTAPRFSDISLFNGT